MNKKIKVIISLVVIIVILLCFIPRNKQDDNKKQNDALSHDITTIEKYKSKYVGNVSNIGNLFDTLPLNNVSKKYEINSKDCTLTVNYLDTVEDVGKQKVQRDLIYNSIAAMASIDNLNAITYNFSGDSYFFSKKQLEEIFKTPLNTLLDKEIWVEQVQKPLNSNTFVEQFYLS